MAHVFISYKREDIAFAKELETRLGNSGFEVWRDEQIPGGKKWLEEIELQIHESFAVLVIVTPQAMESEWVNYEWVFGRGAGKDILGVYLKEVTTFPCRLNDYQLIDFRTEYVWNRLFSRIEEIRNENKQKIPIPHGASQDVREGIDLVNSGVRENKINGAKHLGELGDRIAVPGLIMMLKNNRQSVQVAAVEALEKLGDSRAAEPLIDCLVQYYKEGGQFGIDNLQEPFDNTIAKALIHIGFEVTSTLVDNLNHKIPYVRMAVALMLGRIKDKRATHALIEASYNNKDEAQRMIIWAMGQIADETCVPVITNTLKSDAIYSVRFECIQALGHMGDKRAYEPLIEILLDNSGDPSTIINHPSGSVSNHSSSFAQLRSAAAQALGALGDKRAVRPLCQVLLSETDSSINSSAYGALLTLVDNNHLGTLFDVMRQFRNSPSGQFFPELVLDVIRSIDTPEALAAVEEWKRENKPT